MRVVAVVLLLVLAGCGGGGSEPDATPKTAVKTSSKASTSPPPAVEPTTAIPKGTPTPEALSDFRCEQDAEGDWNSTGVLSNSKKNPVTYQVTVFIGQATGGEERAKTKQIPNVTAGGSVTFGIGKIPAPQDGGPCHVQVLATK